MSARSPRRRQARAETALQTLQAALREHGEVDLTLWASDPVWSRSLASAVRQLISHGDAELVGERLLAV